MCNVEIEERALTFNESFLLFGGPSPHLPRAFAWLLGLGGGGYSGLTLVKAAIFFHASSVLFGHTVCAQIVFEVLFDFADLQELCLFDHLGWSRHCGARLCLGDIRLFAIQTLRPKGRLRVLDIPTRQNSSGCIDVGAVRCPKICLLKACRFHSF